MPNVKEDPASMMAQANMEASKERKLIPFLDEILDQEDIREDARRKIDSIWKRVVKEGFDISTARRSLVRRAMNRPEI